MSANKLDLKTLLSGSQPTSGSSAAGSSASDLVVGTSTELGTSSTTTTTATPSASPTPVSTSPTSSSSSSTSTDTGFSTLSTTTTSTTTTTTTSPSTTDTVTGTAPTTGGGITTQARGGGGGGGGVLNPAPVAPTLAPVPRYFGNTLSAISNADWEDEFKIDQDDLGHLLRLIHPGGPWGGPIAGSDQLGNAFTVSGLRTITSLGNNQTGRTNSVGTTSANWANPDTAYLRLTNAQFGKQESNKTLDALGKPRGYQGTVATVDGTGKVTLNPLLEQTNQFAQGGLRNARTISNVLGEQTSKDEQGKLIPPSNAFGVNEYHMSFGQYVDHGVDFTARSFTSQPYAAAIGELGASSDDLQKVGATQTGVVANQAGYHLREAGSGTLVPVLWLKDSTGAEGLFEILPQSDGSVMRGRTAQEILNRAPVANDLLFVNKTESLFQANQTYGSSEATEYVLRETARFGAGGSYTYSWTNPDGTTGTRTLSGAAGALVWDSQAYGTTRAGYIKTTRILTTRVRMGDGLPGLPTYAEVLLNNGVHEAVIKLALNPGALTDADRTYLRSLGGISGAPSSTAIDTLINNAITNNGLTTAQWQSVAQADPRYINNGNVMNFDPRSADFGTFANQPLNSDLSPAVGALSKTDGRLFGVDQNLDNITDLDPARGGAPKPGQPAITAEDWGAGSLLSHLSGGDWRSNENNGLSSIHSMWLREHNFLAARVRAAINEVAPANWRVQISDDDVYEMAREILIGQYQKMVFEEYLPKLAGTWGTEFGGGDHGWDGYNPNVDGSASLEFATAAFRTPHSSINEELIQDIGLFSMFLSPQNAMTMGVSAINAGLLKVASEAIDTRLTDAVRNNLVTQRLDLLAANTMRNRALGIADYQSMKRQLFTEGPLHQANATAFARFTVGNALFRPDANWAEFGSKLRDWQPSRRGGRTLAFNANDPNTYGTSNLRDRFMFLYGGFGSVATSQVNGETAYTVSGITTTQMRSTTGLDTIDTYLAMLAERPTAETGQVGPLASWVIWENADRQQEGDRFYYLDRLKKNGPNVWNELDTLGAIIERTSDPALALSLDSNQEGVFTVMPTINPLNLSAYQSSYTAIGSQLNAITNLWNSPDPWANAVAANVGVNGMEPLA